MELAVLRCEITSERAIKNTKSSSRQLQEMRVGNQLRLVIWEILRSDGSLAPIDPSECEKMRL
jgi:hypothetical protein